ncbi:MAG: hypothetical protein JXD23_16040 [Spirochaetales bacterium]|nr:hypothetical protein [Spirochaetales bacterium]
MKHIVKAVLLAAAGMLLACVPPAATGDADSRAIAPPACPIQITVATDKPVYHYGETVSMTLQAKNVSSRPVTLNFMTSQRYDFIVSYQGKVLWQWSKDKVFLQVIGSITLKPGQSISYRTAEYKALVTLNSIVDRTLTLDLTGILTSVPRYTGQTKFKVNLLAH